MARSNKKSGALLYWKQSVSENNKNSGTRTLPSSSTNAIPASRKPLQFSSSLSKLSRPQSKRKRDEVFTEDTSERKPGALEPSARHLLRKSARLRERNDQLMKNKSQELHQLPSPSRSYSSNKKRNRSDICDLNDHSSSFKKSRASEKAFDGDNNYNPINNWIETGNWPIKFAEKGVEMSGSNKSSGNPKKRSRTSSYSQSVKEGEVPMQYTAGYEAWIFTKGLDMDPLRGEEYVSEESKMLCISLQEITRMTIKPSIFPEVAIRKVMNLCRNRNEAIVNRDVTPLLVPSIPSLYFGGENHLEHVVDEVNTNWDERCVLAGPRIRPDLAIGLSRSAFTSAEIDKLINYTAIDNWTRFTEHMYFPFLMCEVKCGTEGLDTADRQNMHSSSVAVRALLRIEQEADKYRSEKKFAGLSGQTLVFSISHDQQDVRLYGHYALICGEKWSYHRYPINTFSILTSEDDILAIYNFVQNLFKTYLSGFVQRLKDVLKVLPDSSWLPFSTSEMILNNDNSQKNSQNRDADGFTVPGPPASTLRSDEFSKMTEQLEQQRMESKQQMDKLLEQMEQQRQESKEERERERKESKEKEERMDRERKESKEKEERMEGLIEQQREELSELIKLITNSKTAT